MKPDLTEIKNAAYGRWPEIHAALGIPAKLLNTRKHQPCPHCGGKDRYRYTDHQGAGGFICNQCTPQGGSGFDLLMLVFGYDFKEAARQVAAVLGFSDDRAGQYQARRPLPSEPAAPIQDKQPALLKTWHEACPLDGNDPASLYLQSRGLPPDSWQWTGGAIRFHSALSLYALRALDGHTAAPLLIGYYPAMIAAVTDTGGSLQGLHLTYLAPDSDDPHRWHKLNATHPETGEALPAKKMRARYPEALRGAAVALAAPDTDGRILVSEGIETALAARALFGIPAVATLSAIGMTRWQYPPTARSLFIAADNDNSKTGIKAAESLARRAISDGFTASIWQSDTAGFDALDEYNTRQADKKKPSET